MTNRSIIIGFLPFKKLQSSILSFFFVGHLGWYFLLKICESMYQGNMHDAWSISKFSITLKYYHFWGSFKIGSTKTHTFMAIFVTLSHVCLSGVVRNKVPSRVDGPRKIGPLGPSPKLNSWMYYLSWYPNRSQSILSESNYDRLELKSPKSEKRKTKVKKKIKLKFKHMEFGFSCCLIKCQIYTCVLQRSQLVLSSVKKN
jgi:hypothetical protein